MMKLFSPAKTTRIAAARHANRRLSRASQRCERGSSAPGDLCMNAMIMGLLGYAVFGPSRLLVLGPDSSLGPMIAATILPLIAAKGDPKRAVALASLLAIMVAAITIIAAVARLGFIADLISKPTMIGYMNGLAL